MFFSENPRNLKKKKSEFHKPGSLDVAMERDDGADRGAGRTRADAAHGAQWRMGLTAVLSVLRANRFCSGAGQHAASSRGDDRGEGDEEEREKRSASVDMRGAWRRWRTERTLLSPEIFAGRRPHFRAADPAG